MKTNFKNVEIPSSSFYTLLLYGVKEAVQISSSFNGSAIRALTPPPSSLMAAGTSLSEKKL